MAIEELATSAKGELTNEGKYLLAHVGIVLLYSLGMVTNLTRISCRITHLTAQLNSRPLASTQRMEMISPTLYSIQACTLNASRRQV